MNLPDVEQYIELLHQAEAILRKLPADTALINIDIRDGGAIRIHLYEPDMKAVAQAFDTEPFTLPFGEYFPNTYYDAINADGAFVFQIIERAAALSGTEDSGNEKDVT